jgi:hypothetical protein
VDFWLLIWRVSLFGLSLRGSVIVIAPRPPLHNLCPIEPDIAPETLTEKTFRIPAGTQAIVHTHLFGEQKPSKQDIEQAHRNKVPSYVITRRELWFVTGFAKPRIVYVGIDWMLPEKYGNSK